MASDRFRFTVGGFECLVINDGTSTGATSRMFSNVDDATRSAHDLPDNIAVGYNVCAVYSDDWVLLDTGIGNAGDTEGQVADILDDEDIRPEHIIMTHAHVDHYGGLIGDNGEEKFPNVPVYMCQNEWVWFTSSEYADDNPERAEVIKAQLLPAERQVERIECNDMSEILPGFTIVSLPGHTPHHIGIMIASQDERLIIAGDALLHPLHLENLDWQFANDTDHERARKSRIKLAEIAIDTNALVLNYHFPFPGLGRIERNGDAYRWLPLAE
ncbi:MAG: MBL fold metallo-hydrolase [Chloroflexota bacterium]